MSYFCKKTEENKHFTRNDTIIIAIFGTIIILFLVLGIISRCQ